MTDINSCTPLTAASKLNDLQYLGLNLRQNATLERLYTTMQANTMARVASILGPKYMVAARSLTATHTLPAATYSLPLAKDQWILEVMNWADIMMINTQKMVVEFATGPSNPQFIQRFSTPKDPEQNLMCFKQRIPSLDHYTSVNVLGMVIVFSVGFLIIFVNYYLDPMVWGIERLLQKDPRNYKHARWILDGTLQLQRVYCQSLGLGEWEYCEEEIPISPPGVKFRMPANFEDVGTKNMADAENARPDVMGRSASQQDDETKCLMSAEGMSPSPTDSSISPRTAETTSPISPGENNPTMGDRTIAQQDSKLGSPGLTTDSKNRTVPQQLHRWPTGRRDRYTMLADDDKISLVET